MKKFIKEMAMAAAFTIIATLIVAFMVAAINWYLPQVEVEAIWNGPDQAPEVVRVFVWEKDNRVEKTTDWLKTYKGDYRLIYVSP